MMHLSNPSSHQTTLNHNKPRFDPTQPKPTHATHNPSQPKQTDPNRPKPNQTTNPNSRFNKNSESPFEEICSARRGISSITSQLFCYFDRTHLGVDDAPIHPILRPQQLARHTNINGGLFLVSGNDPHHHPPPHQLLDGLPHPRLQLILNRRSSQQCQALHEKVHTFPKVHVNIFDRSGGAAVHWRCRGCHEDR